MVENSLKPKAENGARDGAEGGTAATARLGPGQRVYVVGDVHGHRDKLEAVHAQVRADLLERPVAEPLLVHLGDLIDRGPDSAGCLALLAAGPPVRGVPTVNLMGNHEWMMLNALQAGMSGAGMSGAGRAGGGHEEIEGWLDNGGAEALRSWGLKSTEKPRAWLAAIPARQLVLLRDLQLTHVEGGYLFVHAGVRPGVRLDRQRETDLLWIRESFLKWNGVMLPETPGLVVVHGHTPTPAPVLKHNRIGLDTGAGKGGMLTCAVLEGDEVRLFQT